VVNFDAAKDIDTHVHRVGRTGRAGDKDGTAYTLLLPGEARVAGEGGGGRLKGQDLLDDKRAAGQSGGLGGCEAAVWEEEGRGCCGAGRQPGHANLPPTATRLALLTAIPPQGVGCSH
jgi:hypothetical protein